MELFFKWCQEKDEFSPECYGINQLNIFSFMLKEREGEFPLVTLEIQNMYNHFSDFGQKNWCFISYQNPLTQKYELLFKGRLSVIPHKIEGETMMVNFSTLPSDWQDRLQFLHGTLKNSSYWNTFFVDEESQNDPIESLDTRSELFFWCRKTGEVKLSNIFWGTYKVDMTNAHYYESLKIRMGEPPLKAVQLTLSAQWLQKYEGKTDLSYLIQKQFREGIVNTLTGKDLEKKWWSKNKKIGYSHYWIVESNLKEITPNFTGNLNLYPTYSSPLWIGPQDPILKNEHRSHAIQKKLKRSWYKVKLILGWFYRQKRQEIIEFTLMNDIQLSSIDYQKVRKLNFHLQDIVPLEEGYPWNPNWNYSKGFCVIYENQIFICLKTHHSSEKFSEDKVYWQKIKDQPKYVDIKTTDSFLTSKMGQKCIEHTIEIARAHLAASARAIEIIIVVSLEYCLNLTCDHSIKIKDHRLPYEEVWGKIKALKFMIDGKTGKQFAEITIGVSIGAESNKELSLFQEEQNILDQYSYNLEYKESDYCSDVIMGYSPSGICYKFIQKSDVFFKKKNPHILGVNDIVEEIKISNPAYTQNKYLLQHQYPEQNFLETNLKQVPTNIHLRLMNLRSCETITDYYQLNLPYSWSAPRQINLEPLSEHTI